MMNTVTFHGRVGKLYDTSRGSSSGKVVQAFSLAVETRRKDRTGEWRKDTTWHRIVAFGPLAEHVMASVHVGDLVTVTAQPHNDDYTIPGGDEEVIAAGFAPTDDRGYEARPSRRVGSSRVDLQACKLEYSIVSPK